MDSTGSASAMETSLTDEQHAWATQFCGMNTKAPSAAADKLAPALPQPMLPDCKVVHGKVPGPSNHLLCATHGHVVDATAHTIIAHTLDEYIKSVGSKSPSGKPGNAAAKTHEQTKQAQLAAEKKHGDLEKKHGNIKVDLSLVVHGINGPRDGLTIDVIAQPDHGEQMDEIGVAKFKGLGGGKYVAPGSWLPRGGFMEFTVLSSDKQHITLKTIQYPCPGKGLLRLEANEIAKASAVSTGRTISTTYGKSGTVQASAGVGGDTPGNIGGSATWTTGGGIGDSTGLSDAINESSGEFDVKVIT
jgi:hypothetical protein